MKKLFFLPLLLITCFCFAQNAKAIIGKPIKIGNILVAQNDFPKELNWEDAKIACRNLGKGWRLPTRAEWSKILYKNRSKIGGFEDGAYWSSTESIDYDYIAWVQNFPNPTQGNDSKSNSYFVRAVRTF